MIKWGVLIGLVVVFLVRVWLLTSVDEAGDGGIVRIQLKRPFFMSVTERGDRFVYDDDGIVRMFVFNANTGYVYGDEMVMEVELKVCDSVQNMGAFNYCDWLYRNGVDYLYKVQSHDLVRPSSVWVGLQFLSLMPQLIMERLRQLIPDCWYCVYVIFWGAQDLNRM